MSELKICTGCQMTNDKPLGLNIKGEAYLACCPDNSYIPLKDYLSQKDSQIAVMKEALKVYATPSNWESRQLSSKCDKVFRLRNQNGYTLAKDTLEKAGIV